MDIIYLWITKQLYRIVRTVDDRGPTVRVSPEGDGRLGQGFHSTLEDHGVPGCCHRDAWCLDCWDIWRRYSFWLKDFIYYTKGYFILRLLQGMIVLFFYLEEQNIMLKIIPLDYENK